MDGNAIRIIDVTEKPTEDGLFDIRITLGNVITIIGGVVVLVAGTWQISNYARDVIDKQTKVEERLSAVEVKVTEISEKMDRQLNKRADIGMENPTP